MSNARQVVTRSPHRTVGRINRCSHLQTEPIDYESQLEKQFVLLAMLCPAIVRIKHQPFTLKLDGPEFRKYTPDFLATLEDGTYAVIEIKPKSKVKKDFARFQAIAAVLAERGLPFFVITDEEIKGRKRHENAELILRYVNWNIDPLVQSAVSKLFEAGQRLTIDIVEKRTEAALEDLMHLVAQRHLCTSNLAMTPDTLLQFKDSEAHHGILQFSKWFNAQVWCTTV